jgi:hypothetical protein
MSAAGSVRSVVCLLALVLLGCQGADKTQAPCARDLADYRIKGSGLLGDVDGDGDADRVTLRADERRLPRCRHLLVVEMHAGATAAAVVKPLPWPGTNPQLLLLAEIDRRTGLEPVVELSPANVYRPGAVFTLRDGKLVRMRLETTCCPDDLFPFYDEFPSGVDCLEEPGTIVATFGNLARGGDRHWAIKRSSYRAAGIRFELYRNQRFRIEVGPEAERRWPEIRGDPFLSCPGRVD